MQENTGCSGASNCNIPLPTRVGVQDAVPTARGKGLHVSMIGEQVLISGLIQSPHFNGRWGLVESYDADMQRFVVRVFTGEGQSVLAKLRPETLVMPVGR